MNGQTPLSVNPAVVNALAAEIRKLQASVGNYPRELAALKNELAALKQQYTAAVGQAQLAQQAKPINIEDIPGPRRPVWPVKRVAFTPGATGAQSIVITNGADGPLVYTKIHALWRPSDGLYADRLLPLSAISGIVNSGGPVNMTAAALANWPEFAVKLQSSGQFLSTNEPEPVPWAMLTDGQSSPEYLSISGWLERSDTFTAEFTPLVACPTAGHLYFGLIGYKILIPTSLMEALGWQP